MNKNYPIKPRHLDTKEEPKGFENLLDYGQRGILWAFIQFCQSRGNWNPFTHEEFIAFISDPDSKVNTRVKCGVIWFVEDRLRSIFNYEKVGDGKDDVIKYTPTHFVISTYFLWNPLRKV